MSVLSKYVDRIAEKCEHNGLTKHAFSYALVTSAILALTVKVTIPYAKSGNTQKGKHKGNNGALTPSETDISEEDSKLAEAEKLLVAQQLKKKSNNFIEPGLNKEFLKQLKMLAKIMVPQTFCYETGLLSIHTFCLISRTFLSIYVAALEGALVKFIVRKDVKEFALVLLKWFGIAIPATFVNSMIRFLESKLALAFR